MNFATKIYTLQIETYYFSCNLDHVLYNIRNLKQELKEEYAINFADQYEGNESNFIKFINKDNFPLSNDYNESWDKIKLSLNSILRYSNFNVFF